MQEAVASSSFASKMVCLFRSHWKQKGKQTLKAVFMLFWKT